MSTIGKERQSNWPDPEFDSSLSGDDEHDALAEGALRQARIDQQRVQSLHHRNPEIAILREIQLNYNQMTFSHQGVLLEMSNDNPRLILESPEYQKALALTISLSREAARNGNLAQRIEEAQDAKQSNARRAEARKWMGN